MRKEDFKSITKEHIEFCKDLISRKRNNCSLCPLSSYNAVNNGTCASNGYAYAGVSCLENKLAMKSAKEFLELFEGDFIEDKKNFEVLKDNVNSPNHYRLSVAGHDVEVIDIIKAVLTPEEFRGYLKGNSIKYIMRENNKNHIEDLEKCRNYLNWLIERDKNE